MSNSSPITGILSSAPSSGTRPVPGLPTYHRAMTGFDIPDVLSIEWASFNKPWRETDFYKAMKAYKNLCYVAYVKNRICAPGHFYSDVLGFIVLRFFRSSIRILNLAVDPRYRMRGVARQMLVEAGACLAPGPGARDRITVLVPDTNLDAHLFFNKCGFRAVEMVRGIGSGDGNQERDGYLFEYRLDA